MATRREFIKKGSLATLVGVTSGLVINTNAFGFEQFYEIPIEIRNGSIYSFTEAEMKLFTKTVFEVRNKEKNKFASLKLIEVSGIDYSKKPLRKVNSNSFSMLLKGTSGTKLEQGTYDFNHKQIGKFSALLVPVTSDENYYEVIFNNLRN